MPWQTIERNTIISDGDPPPNQGDMLSLNLFWWPAISRVCFVTRNVTTGYLELWARRLTGASIWELLSTSPTVWIGTTPDVQAAVDGVDGKVVLAVYETGGYGGYRFGRLSISGTTFTWEEPWLTQIEYTLPGSFMMCSGTAGTHPRLLGQFYDNWSLVEWSIGSFDPTGVGSGDGLVLHTCTLPTDRVLFAMEYDHIRDTIVIFGGGPASFEWAPCNEVWEGKGTDGEGFTQVVWTGDGPSARTGPAMCYDSKRGGMLTYGGSEGAPSYDVVGRGGWLWNGTLWTRVGAEVPQSDPIRGGAGVFNEFFRYNARMAYDESRNVPVLFRGRNPD